MKRLLFITLFFLCLASIQGQGSKFKTANRTPVDSAGTASSFRKDALAIDGESDAQLRSGSNPYATGQRTQLPNRINHDSLPVVVLKPADRDPVYIEREHSQLRSAKPMTAEEAALSFFRETPSLKINKPEVQIRIDRIETDELGIAHVKGMQVFRDTPVYGMNFTFHISDRNERFMGYTLDPAEIDTVTAGRLFPEEAVRIAEHDLQRTTEIRQPNALMKQQMQYDQPEIESIYYPDRFSTYRFCYKVTIRPNFRDVWIYYIDSQSGEILDKHNNTQSDGANKGTGRDVHGDQRTVDTYIEGSTHYMVNITKPMFNASKFSGAIMVYDARSNKDFYTEHSTASFAANNSIQWNNPSAISTMYNVTIVYDYLKQTHNRNSFDDKGSDMLCVVNVPAEDGSGYDNAFWNGKFIALGTGKNAFISLAGGLDVIAHEFGHAVVEYTAKLEYKNQSGAINETYADIFGAMVDRANWTIGEKIVKDKGYFPSGALRDMANPHNGDREGGNGWQPAHVSEMYLGSEDNGGVHINSGIGNYAYYLYATATSKEKAEKVYYRALANYLTPTSKFVDLRIAVVNAAKDLYGNTDADLVATTFDRVGIVQESTGSPNPTDLPTNTGQQGLLLTQLDYSDRNGLYKTTNYTSFTPISTSRLDNKPSITDDGEYCVFINDKNVIRLLDITTGQESNLSSDDDNASVAISRDGNRLAVVSTWEDGLIWVYDFVSRKWANFKLYNPTTGTGGAQSGGVRFADAIEFDHSGEYLVYDAYNVVGNRFGGKIDYWDIGVIHVWDNNKKTFGSGSIEKLFSALEQGVSIGNPTFSKNSPHIMAFDYFDDEGTYATFGVNLATGDLDVMFTNTSPAYPNYSMDDKRLAFTSYDKTKRTYFTGYIALGNNKITTTGNGTGIANETAWPVYYATGTRQLGLKPTAAFSADVRSGSGPLNVQFVDLSENNPTSWNWTFQGGSPATSNQQHPKVTYNTQGTYPVKLVATNTYGYHETTKQGYITVGGTTGMEFIEQQTLTVYPNPATDYAWVSCSVDNVKDVQITDFTGKNLPVAFSGEGGSIRVDVSSLCQGFYVLKIRLSDGKILTQKLVVK